MRPSPRPDCVAAGLQSHNIYPHTLVGPCSIYDAENGGSCHQCRQKTLGLRTSCSRCKSGLVRWG